MAIEGRQVRVNIDSSVPSDPRFQRLAWETKLDLRHAVGCCYFVWLACYQRRTCSMSIVDVDVAANHPGFAHAMVACDLARSRGPERVIIAGVRERIKYLKRQSELGRRGGKTKARNRLKASSERLANATANAKRTPSEPPSLPPDLAPDLALAPDQAPDLTVRGDTADIKRARARIEPPAEAYGLADHLRAQVLQEQPGNRLRQQPWPGARRDAWARTLDLAHRRDGRSWDELREAIDWVFAQVGDIRFVVHSPAALREKFDRVQAAITRSRAPSRRVRDEQGVAAAWDAAEQAELQWRSQSASQRGGDEPQ